MPRYHWFYSTLLALTLSSTLCYGQTLELTEARVRQLAQQQNLNIKIAEAEQAIHKTQIQQAKSTFDTFLSADGSYRVDKGEKTSVIFGTSNRTAQWNLGLAKRLPTGTQASLAWKNRKETTNSTFTTLNPYYESSLEFGLQQPLLKNIWGVQDRGRVNLAKKNYTIAQLQTERAISAAIYQVLIDYWRWITDSKQVAITTRSLHEAQKFENISKEKEQFGLHESTDVLAARANRLQIANLLLGYIQQRDNSLGRLKHGLDLAEGQKVSTKERIQFIKHATPLPEALTTALQHRPEYLAAKAAISASDLQLTMAKNSLWPQLDLVASLRVNGVRGNYGNAARTAAGLNNTDYLIGGTLEIPLENRFARSEKSRAEAEKSKSLYQFKNTEHAIAQDVEEQWREVTTSIQRVQANRSIETVQRQKWQEELKKYRTGRSSSDLVIRYHEDYNTAQRATMESLYIYRLAVLGLDLAQNTLLP